MEGKFDPILSKILEGGLEGFFETMYSFLYRKTDYFIVSKKKDNIVGHLPGVSLNMTKNAFNKYMKISARNANGELIDDQVPTTLERPSRKLDPEEEMRLKSGIPIADFDKQIEEEKEMKEVEKKQEQKKEDEKKKDEDSEILTPEQQKLKEEQKLFQNESDSYNGADRLAYKWSQSIEDIDILVKLPEKVVRGNQVKVKIDKLHLFVEYRSENEWKTAINKVFCWPVRNTDSVWSLIPGKHVSISIDKVGERWWEAAFTDEQKINVKNIDASRPMADLDNESQSKIHEMMFNQQQKKAGLPTSDQMKKQDMLKKAWDIEGSPFKGTQFDPTVLKD